ncbi:hypothetical protein N9L68_03565 [bacterium]|nr:hypothetical protein [bacterium]
MIVAGQRATQELLLRQALAVLTGFYEKGTTAALVQEKAKPADPLPLLGSEECTTSAAAGNEMGRNRRIIGDANVMETENIRAEEDAHNTSKNFVTETNASPQVARKAIVNESKVADLVELEFFTRSKAMMDEKETEFRPPSDSEFDNSRFVEEMSEDITVIADGIGDAKKIVDRRPTYLTQTKVLTIPAAYRRRRLRGSPR